MQASDLHNILIEESTSPETLQKLYVLQEKYPYFQYLNTVICLKDSNQKNIQNAALRTVNRAILQNLLRSSFDPDHHRKHLVKYEIEEDDLNFIQKIKSDPITPSETEDTTELSPKDNNITEDLLIEEDTLQEEIMEETLPLFDSPEYEYPTFENKEELTTEEEEVIIENENIPQDPDESTSNITPIEETEAVDSTNEETEEIKQNIENSLLEMEALKHEIDLRKAEILDKLDTPSTEEEVQFEEPNFPEPEAEDIPEPIIEFPSEHYDDVDKSSQNTEDNTTTELIQEEITADIEEEKTPLTEKETITPAYLAQQEETNKAIDAFIKDNFKTIKSPSFFLDELIASSSSYKVEKEPSSIKPRTSNNNTSTINEGHSNDVEDQNKIIANFIKSSPGAISFDEQQIDVQNPDLSLESNHYKGLKTEYLAKIFVSQGKYNNAIEIYQELSLNNPDKKSYFASLIEKLKKG